MLVPGARPSWARRPTPEERRAALSNQRWATLVLEIVLYGALLVGALNAGWGPVVWGAAFGLLATVARVVARQVLRHRRAP